MTITKHDGIAFIPKRCDTCNRLFWLEQYNIYHMNDEVTSIKFIKCLECEQGLDEIGEE